MSAVDSVSAGASGNTRATNCVAITMLASTQQCRLSTAVAKYYTYLQQSAREC